MVLIHKNVTCQVLSILVLIGKDIIGTEYFLQLELRLQQVHLGYMHVVPQRSIAVSAI